MLRTCKESEAIKDVCMAWPITIVVLLFEKLPERLIPAYRTEAKGVATFEGRRFGNAKMGHSLQYLEHASALWRANNVCTWTCLISPEYEQRTQIKTTESRRLRSTPST